MADNGFDSVYSLLAIDIDTDLHQIPDILLGQKSILREALQKLKKQFKQMGIESKDETIARQLLEESLLSGQTSKKTSTSITTNDDSLLFESNGCPTLESYRSSTSTKKSSKKVSQKEKENTESPNVTESLPQTVAERFGLRSSTKKPKRFSFDDESEPFKGIEPEVVISTPLVRLPAVLLNRSKACDVCDRDSEKQFPNGTLCDLCYRFYKKYIRIDDQLVCDEDNNCLISKDNNKNCRSCRWNRCSVVVSSSSVEIENSYDCFMENTEYVSETQPTIDLTPIKERPPKKRKSNKKKTSDLCQVCGDGSTGTNYGVLSCNGCGIFFKRVYSQEMKVGQCTEAHNKCVIDPSTRNKCRSCRYQACLKAGMGAGIAATNSRNDEPPEEEGEDKEEEEEEVANNEHPVDTREELPANRSDVSETTGYDYASIHCGRTPESPIRPNRNKRQKNYN